MILPRYHSTGVPIQIRVYEDQIRFWNDGQLPEGWTVQRLLQKHVSKPYNPLIAGAFFRTGDIESWGRGIDKIRDACQGNGTDFPTFEFEQTGLMVEFKGLVPEIQEPPDGGLPKTPEKTRVETRVETPERILDQLRAHPNLTLVDVAKAVGKSTSAVERACSKLKKQGRLRHVGPRKGGHWEVIE